MRGSNTIRTLLIVAACMATSAACAQESRAEHPPRTHSPLLLDAPLPAQTTPSQFTRSLGLGLSSFGSISSSLGSASTANAWHRTTPGVSPNLLSPDAAKRRLTFSFSPFKSKAGAPSRSLEHYSHMLPGAGPLILLGDRTAKQHPQVTRVLKFLAPIR